MPHDVIPLALQQIGETDCETIGRGWLAQPANTISSAAYLVFGLWIVVRAMRHPGSEQPVHLAFGIALSGVGIGSILFHGPMPPGARLLHDLTIAAVFVLIGARAIGTMRRWDVSQVIGTFAGVTGGIGLLMALSAAAGIAAAAVIGLLALALEVHLYRTGRREAFSSQLAAWAAGIGGLLLAGLLFQVLGRTGGPWCDPESVLQGHAAWHVLTAAGFGLYGYRAFLSPQRAATSLR